MALTARGDVFLEVLWGMAADERIVDDLVEAARAQAPEVARLPAAETRRHVAVLFAAGLAAFERAGDPSERDFAEAARLGADRAAQGISIGGLLAAVQAGRTRALEIAVQRARAADIPDGLLLEVLLDMDRYLGALERHVISGYRAAERDLAGGRAEAGDRALRGLLLGEEPGPSPAELARLGLRPDGRYHCLVADVVDPARQVGLRLAAAGGLCGTVAGRPAALTPRLPAPGDTDVPVVAAPAVPLRELRAVYGLCLAALPLAARSPRRGIHLLVDHAADLALTAQPLLAGLASAAVLGELRPADDFHRELASTALAYLDHGRRLDHTATALHVHPNTVRYRLRRLHELTGVPVVPGEEGDRRTVLELLQLWWALRTWLEPRSAGGETSVNFNA
ncbi:helix-turn-helix domain-containing protein [Actinoplanes sp. NPDC049118]|uniref:helix-turn-helix domain-containing protein n=1 Tax=Actinoplanes sp. NPDC049118 TaxID=3155769 RepID=UPI0033E26EC4